MSARIKELYLITMYMLGLAGIALLVFTRISSLWICIFFSLIWLFSFTIRNLFIYNTDRYIKLAFVTYIIELVLLIFVGGMGAGESIKLLLLISFADCCIVWGIAYGLYYYLIIISCYILFISGIHRDQIVKDILTVTLRESPVFLLTGIISYLIGKVIKGNQVLEVSIKEREEREVRLRAAYHELNLAYQRLEEVSKVEERNRIARQIHDTVGHTLTTVIVELEAGKLLAAKDPGKSAVKFDMARQQAIKALDEMRYSVKMLSDNTGEKSLKQLVIEVIEQTAKHTGTVIKYEIELPEGINLLGELVVRTLKECISNSLRHGRSTAFFFKLQLKDNKLYFLLQDNGIGCRSFTPGFGLGSMKEGIEKNGGRINFRTEPEEGFEVEFELPVFTYQ